MLSTISWPGSIRELIRRVCDSLFGDTDRPALAPDLLMVSFVRGTVPMVSGMFGLRWALGHERGQGTCGLR